ncbi:MAG: 60S ribosomal protein L31 [Candidatus Aenigmarchaeota archaeon]|nr:60S ribosomal protein L31 [Candidatus Aenigmarchaeota archaeon]
MAKKEEVGIEKVYTIPLRSEFTKVPALERVNRSVSTIRAYLYKHLDADDVKISQKTNESLWKGGIKRPPAKIRVKVELKDGIATARLPDEKTEKSKKEKKGLVEKAKGITGGKSPEEFKEQIEKLKEEKGIKKKEPEVKDTPKNDEIKKSTPEKPKTEKK